jgi:hypothetical protein
MVSIETYIDTQLRPKALAAPSKNPTVGDTEIGWFGVKNCGEKGVK